MGSLEWDDQKAVALIDTVHAEAGAFLGPYGETASALLPILHALQAHFGYIHASVLPHIAERLNISKAEVHGALSFYHDFHTAPVAKHRLKICRAEACQSMGCEDLVGYLEQKHGLIIGEPSLQGRLAIENVYCLGNCGLAPAALLDERPIGRLDRSKLDAVIKRVQGALTQEAHS